MKKRELKRGIIRTIRDREMYGYELRKILAARGEEVQLSYLYRTLKEMRDDGLLESRLQAGGAGPQRRMHRLTAKGKKELGRVFGEAAELIHDFYEDYMAKLPPPFFMDRFRMMMTEIYGGREAVGLVLSEPLTHLHRKLLERICARPGAKRTYLIKPPGVKAEVDLPNVTVVEGTLDDIPLKDGSLGGMVVVDIQDAVRLNACCAEFRRVLQRGGVMCGCAPFMGLEGGTEPLGVGAFMKRSKYVLSGRPYHDKEAIKNALAMNFDSVDIASMGFLTAFIGGLRPIRSE